MAHNCTLSNSHLATHKYEEPKKRKKFSSNNSSFFPFSIKKQNSLSVMPELNFELEEIFRTRLFNFPLDDQDSAREVFQYLIDQGVPEDELAHVIKSSDHSLNIWLNQNGRKKMVGEWTIAWLNKCYRQYLNKEGRLPPSLPTLPSAPKLPKQDCRNYEKDESSSSEQAIEQEKNFMKYNFGTDGREEESGVGRDPFWNASCPSYTANHDDQHNLAFYINDFYVSNLKNIFSCKDENLKDNIEHSRYLWNLINYHHSFCFSHIDHEILQKEASKNENEAENFFFGNKNTRNIFNKSENDFDKLNDKSLIKHNLLALIPTQLKNIFKNMKLFATKKHSISKAKNHEERSKTSEKVDQNANIYKHDNKATLEGLNGDQVDKNSKEVLLNIRKLFTNIETRRDSGIEEDLEKKSLSPCYIYKTTNSSNKSPKSYRTINTGPNDSPTITFFSLHETFSRSISSNFMEAYSRKHTYEESLRAQHGLIRCWSSNNLLNVKPHGIIKRPQSFSCL